MIIDVNKTALIPGSSSDRGIQTSREDIIEIGLGLIRTGGYTPTWISHVLEMAKVASLYDHFTSKDAFVLAVIERYATVERERWGRLLDGSDIPPLKKLRCYFRDLISTYGCSGGPIAGSLLGNLCVGLARQNEEIRLLLCQEFDAWQTAIARTIRECIEKQELSDKSDADEMAAFLVDSWEGAQVRAKTEQSDKALELFFDYAFTTLLKDRRC
jgi:TetR/AcrR family transcriptional repressor of nem operon